jgi:hypothetical protein
MATRDELLAAIRSRYGEASRAEKARILDEFVAVSDYHRKHAIRLVGSGPKPRRTPRPARRRYGEAAREALIALWEASDRICSKRLKPLIPVLLPALERHGRLALDDELRARLLAVSPATMDRLLVEVRLVARGGQRRRAGFSSAVRRAVPVRTFGDWNDPLPGYLEVDLVAHAGTSAAGAFVQTMVLTDIATGWTECVPLVVRDGGLVIEALAKARELFPFPLLGVDFDNDSAFMNETVIDWCRTQSLEVTRSRAYRKNDQAWVEQKNGAIVRRLIGYGRFEGLASAEALSRLFAAARLHGNLFQPSFKLSSKTRIGARVIKRYHAPEPPVSRVIAHPAVDDATKARLKVLRDSCDPIVLLSEIRAAQAELGKRIDRRGVARSRGGPSADLDPFIAHLGTAWRDGERRPTHRRPYRRVKPIPRRPSALDPVESEIDAWLTQQLELSAVAILSRLRALQPGVFDNLHVRTVQRAVKVWRARKARRIILEGTSVLRGSPPVDLMDDAAASPTAPQAPPPQPPCFNSCDTKIPGNIAI